MKKNERKYEIVKTFTEDYYRTHKEGVKASLFFLRKLLELYPDSGIDNVGALNYHLIQLAKLNRLSKEKGNVYVPCKREVNVFRPIEKMESCPASCSAIVNTETTPSQNERLFCYSDSEKILMSNNVLVKVQNTAKGKSLLIADIVKATGVTKSAIYSHLRIKSDFYSQFIEGTARVRFITIDGAKLLLGEILKDVNFRKKSISLGLEALLSWINTLSDDDKATSSKKDCDSAALKNTSAEETGEVPFITEIYEKSRNKVLAEIASAQKAAEDAERELNKKKDELKRIEKSIRIILEEFNRIVAS